MRTVDNRSSGARGEPLPSHAAGTSLIEVLVAVGIGVTVLGPLATLLFVGASSLALARETSLATSLAMRKMEQLTAAVWAVDAAGAPVSDTASDFTAAPPPPPTGGTGLSASPSWSLVQNCVGFVDYLDSAGNWIGAGSLPPPGAAYVRRWHIEPSVSDPADSLVLQVLVVPRGRLAPDGYDYSGREPGTVRLVSARTRRSP